MAINPEARDLIRARSDILRSIRDTLFARGFLEVETPILQQIAGLKREAGDAVLLTRMGDFYEILGDDAVRAAPVLEIALTMTVSFAIVMASAQLLMFVQWWHLAGFEVIVCLICLPSLLWQARRPPAAVRSRL